MDDLDIDMIATNYRQAFEAINTKDTPDWVQRLRRQGYEQFKQAGWPTMRQEAWKYTSTKALQQQAYVLAASTGAVDTQALDTVRVPDSVALVFVDGLFRPELSDLTPIPAGVTVDILSHSENTESLQEALVRTHTEHDTLFASLNSAFLQDGLSIRVAKQVVCKPLLHVIHLFSQQDKQTMAFPRQVFEVGVSAQAAILQTVISGTDVATFLNALTEIKVAANGQLAYALTQAENLAAYQVHNTHIHLAADSRLEAFCLTTGGKWVRNDLTVILDGSNIEAHINGLYVPRGEQHVDNQTMIDHRAPNSMSSQLYKGVLEDKGRAVFSGKIFVRDVAQQTNAYQLNRNLLLSEEAEVDTRPQLEIFADDVRCTHGATIGPVNPDEIFYLQSRGIKKEQAVQTLAQGFARETLGHLSEPRLQKVLGRTLEETFGTQEDRL